MANALAIRAKFETLRSLAFGGITANYAAIGGAYVNPIRILKIANNTDADMLISFDGTNNHDFVGTGGFVLYDFCSNESLPAGFLCQPVGTTVYVKQVAAPTSGSVYVTVVYAI